MLPIPAILIALNLVQGVIGATLWPFAAAAVIAGSIGLGLYASRRGKFVVWA